MDQILNIIFALFCISTLYVNIYAPFFKVNRNVKLDVMDAYVNLELSKRYVRTRVPKGRI